MNSTIIKQILPPQSIGIIGGGQLGQMLAIKSREMGYKVIILDPDINAPAKDFANTHLVYDFNDKIGLNKLSQMAEVITTEFENVPAESLEFLEQQNLVYPPSNAVKICQNRIKEKDFFNSIAVKTVPYCKISCTDEINKVKVDMFPAILKTTTLGYDGKGQIVVPNQTQLLAAFNQLGKYECILEKRINLKLETSIIVARNYFETKVYDVNENIHKNGILDITISPARISNEIKNQLQHYAVKIIDNLNYIGVLVIEFFITQDNQILANEMAPRPHNSGHHTIESCITSQFEQQLRAICNIKLGDTTQHTPSIMLNILGDSYRDNQLRINKILNQYDNVKLHLYGKKDAKAGRKMGHLTILGQDVNGIYDEIQQIKQLIN